jgi:hypothetical protein
LIMTGMPFATAKRESACKIGIICILVRSCPHQLAGMHESRFRLFDRHSAQIISKTRPQPAPRYRRQQREGANCSAINVSASYILGLKTNLDRKH